MATPEVVDFVRLLAPIPGDNPAGIGLKDDANQSAVYYAVKDAREAARTAERQIQQAWGEAEQLAGVEPPDWESVVRLASDALAEKSKDLWLAAWLVEGLVRLHGFAGLRDGFRLIRELCENFWDNVHPRPDEDGIATTIAQLTGLNGDDSEGALIAPIKNVPITAEGTHRALSTADYTQATNLEQSADPKARAARIEQGAVTLEMFDTAVRETSGETFRGILDDLEAAIDEFGKMTSVLEQKCGQDDWGYSLAPPSSNIRTVLEECRDRLKSVAKDKLAMLAASAAEQAAVEEGGQIVHVGSDGQGGMQRRLQTRDDAFAALLQVADYFRRTEPHSIVSYALEQVVRWGRMSLPELLKELISDNSVRSDMFRRVGIVESQEQKSDSSGW
jgi:type VI secretion system protein ImpA